MPVIPFFPARDRILTAEQAAPLIENQWFFEPMFKGTRVLVQRTAVAEVHCWRQGGADQMIATFIKQQVCDRVPPGLVFDGYLVGANRLILMDVRQPQPVEPWTYEERRKLLEQLVPRLGTVSIVPQFSSGDDLWTWDTIREFYKQVGGAKTAPWDAVLFKHRTGLYRPATGPAPDRDNPETQPNQWWRVVMP